MEKQKNITLKLLGIKYSGAPIGDDIRIQVEALGSVISIDKKIKFGDEIGLDHVIGQVVVDKVSFSSPITITVVELDPLFNDIGILKETIKIDTSNSFPQISTHRININESRGRIIPSGKQAFFEVILKVFVEPAFWYVGTHADGWITITRDDHLPDASLPASIRVKINKRTSSREYFTVLEGALKGSNASVKYPKESNSYFTQKNPQIKSALVVYSISKKTIAISGKKYLVKDFESSPWVKGFYDIEIPDAPHKGGHSYVKKAPHAVTWFRIGHTGDRYLHTGNVSLGCITVAEHGRWEEIYQALISARKGDGISVGILKVVD